MIRSTYGRSHTLNKNFAERVLFSLSALFRSETAERGSATSPVTSSSGSKMSIYLPIKTHRTMRAVAAVESAQIMQITPIIMPKTSSVSLLLRGS